MSKHCIRSNKRVATNSIERVADAINSALDVGYRGLGIFGFARFGKSESLGYLMNHPDWLGCRKAAFLRMDAPDSHKRSDGTFFKICLALLSMRIPARATPVELGAMVAGRLIEMCQSAGTRLIFPVIVP